jgi:hypothetical protein
MAKIAIPRCSWCGGPLERGRRGPAAITCSPTCRQARRRARRGLARELEPATLTALGPPLAHGPNFSAVPLDDQVARALLETRALGSAWLRLGREARPPFAWRCEMTGVAIISALDTYFEGV